MVSVQQRTLCGISALHLKVPKVGLLLALEPHLDSLARCRSAEKTVLLCAS